MVMHHDLVMQLLLVMIGVHACITGMVLKWDHFSVTVLFVVTKVACITAIGLLAAPSFSTAQ